MIAAATTRLLCTTPYLLTWWSTVHELSRPELTTREIMKLLNDTGINSFLFRLSLS